MDKDFEYRNLNDKLRIFIHIEPYNIRLAGLFEKNSSIANILRFVKEKLIKLNLSFKIGRIELKDNLFILLPEYQIADFLKDGDEVIVYSEDYGINQRIIPGDDNKILYKRNIYFLYEKYLGKKKKKDNNKKEETNAKEKLKEKAEKNTPDKSNNSDKKKSHKKDKERDSYKIENEERKKKKDKKR